MMTEDHLPLPFLQYFDLYYIIIDVETIFPWTDNEKN